MSFSSNETGKRGIVGVRRGWAHRERHYSRRQEYNSICEGKFYDSVANEPM